MLRRLILAVLVCAMLFSISCVGVNSTKVVVSSVLSDGVGNTFIAYRLERSPGDHDIHLQKIDTEGNLLWGEKGIRISP